MKKKCACCGKEFDCSSDESCWCHDFHLSREQLKELREKYADCLCPECLKAYFEGRENLT